MKQRLEAVKRKLYTTQFDPKVMLCSTCKPYKSPISKICIQECGSEVEV